MLLIQQLEFIAVFHCIPAGCTFLLVYGHLWDACPGLKAVLLPGGLSQ